MSETDRGEALLTVPNVLSIMRLVGVLPLLWVARGDHRTAFLWILAALLITDWLDGQLAALLDQRTELGARLDSTVDAVLYAAVAVSYWWLEGDVMREESPWFLAVGVTWMVSVLVSLARFERLPSYHSWAAKAAWLAVAVTAVHWLLTGRGTFVPWALALVILANLEAAAIGFVLPVWQADVPTVGHALRDRRARKASGTQASS
jgi:CDP-diacylglycerol--glycerol-3-phosphate 3-phosphatidyltransferase